MFLLISLQEAETQCELVILIHFYSEPRCRPKLDFIELMWQMRKAGVYLACVLSVDFIFRFQLFISNFFFSQRNKGALKTTLWN